MSYDTTYVANFPPPAKISRHSGLADRNWSQFLCRLRVFRAIYTAGKPLNNKNNNNNTARNSNNNNINIIAPETKSTCL